MMIGVRALIRGTVEVVATGAGLSRIGRRLNRDSVAVLAYHNIVEDTDANRGDTSLHLPIGIFLQQIERLCQTHDIVGLDALQRRSSSARPRAVITFDDAYRGAVTLALPELVRRGLPAVMFVSPGMLDSQSTWWDRLGEAGELTDARRHEALTALEGKRTLIDERMPTPSVTLPDNYAIASREELLEACGTAISIGSHAWEHEYLPALEPAELRDNLERSRAWVVENAPRASNWIAVPYGGISPLVSRAAMDAGYSGVLKVEGGLLRGRMDPGAVPRINVPAGMSSRGVELRSSGVLNG